MTIIPQFNYDKSETEYFLYIHVHNGIILNNKKAEATWVSINEWMAKQNVVYA